MMQNGEENGKSILNISLRVDATLLAFTELNKTAPSSSRYHRIATLVDFLKEHKAEELELTEISR